MLGEALNEGAKLAHEPHLKGVFLVGVEVVLALDSKLKCHISPLISASLNECSSALKCSRSISKFSTRSRENLDLAAGIHSIMPGRKYNRSAEKNRRESDISRSKGESTRGICECGVYRPNGGRLTDSALDGVLRAESMRSCKDMSHRGTPLN